MGLLNRLQQAGSSLSAHDGANPPINPGATQQSKLHADGTQASYSVNGTNAQPVNSAYQQYEDGVNNNLPMPSNLDRYNGDVPQYLRYVNQFPG
jgi:hypothetical protein